MTFFRAVGSFSSGTGVATTTIGVTTTDPDSGTFQPKAIVFWWSGRADTSDAIGAANPRRGFGFATSTTARRAVGTFSLDGAANADVGTYQTDVAAVATTTATAVEGLLDISSFDATGFTMIVDDQFAADLRVHYLALGGTDITKVEIGTFQEPVGTGDQTISLADATLVPSFLMLLSALDGDAPPVHELTASRIGFGMASGPANMGCYSGWSQDGAANMVTSSYCNDIEIMAQAAPASDTITGIATLTSFNAGNFILNWSQRAATRYIFYLVIEGGRHSVGSLLTQTDTTTDIVETGLGIGMPKSIMFVGHGKAESTTDTPQAHDSLSVGAAQSTTGRVSMATMDVDAGASANTGTAVSYDQVLITQGVTDPPAMTGEMDIKSFDSNGFTNIMDDADPAQHLVIYWAVNQNQGPFAEALYPRQAMTRPLARM